MSIVYWILYVRHVRFTVPPRDLRKRCMSPDQHLRCEVWRTEVGNRRYLPGDYFIIGGGFYGGAQIENAVDRKPGTMKCRQLVLRV